MHSSSKTKPSRYIMLGSGNTGVGAGGAHVYNPGFTEAGALEAPNPLQAMDLVLLLVPRNIAFRHLSFPKQLKPH